MKKKIDIHIPKDFYECQIGAFNNSLLKCSKCNKLLMSFQVFYQKGDWNIKDRASKIVRLCKDCI